MSVTGDNQPDRSLQAASPTPANPPQALLDPNAPLVPFQSSLILTRDQEEKLINMADQRVEQLKVEMGRNVCLWHNWWQREDPERPVGGRTFMGKRDYYQMTYDKKLEWRRWALGGIFQESNLNLPVAQRIVRQMIARAVEYFFGTDPWFSTVPVGQADAGIAVVMQKHARWKIQNTTNVKAQLIKSIEMAFVKGEAVVKTAFKDRNAIYRTMENVLVDEAGNMIPGQDGLPITEEDQWVLGTDPMTGQPSQQYVLQRDGVTPAPPMAIYAPQLITKKISLYRGPDCSVVYFKDFLCPLTAEDLQTADLIAHLYDMPVMALIDQYTRRNILNPPTTEQAVADATKMAELLKNLAAEGTVPKTGRNQPRFEWGELQNDSSIDNPVCEIHEVYCTYDADEDGLTEEIMLVYDARSKTPLFYDYLGNVTPDGKRPFVPIRINPIDGRWHGVGGMEMFENSQEFIDLLINRRNFAESAAGRVTFTNPDATLEGQRDKNLKMNNGGSYTLKPGKKPEDALSYVTLPEVKGKNLQEMMEVFMQMMQLESGTINAMDQQVSGLPSAKLATGVNNIEKSGQEMFSLFIEALEPAINEVLLQAVKIIYANMDATEIFAVTEGTSTEILQLTPEQVRDLEIKVDLLLSRAKSQTTLQNSVQAANLTNQFYALPPPVQAQVAPLYIQALKSLEVEQAETIIKALPPPPPGAVGPDGEPMQTPNQSIQGQDAAANIPINDPGQVSPVRST